MRRARRWIFGMATAAILFAATAVFWLVATENGARWLLAQATASLPHGLSVESLDGTLLRGLQLSSVRWDDESLSVSIDRVHTQFALLPLLRRNLDVSVLDVQTVAVTIGRFCKSNLGSLALRGHTNSVPHSPTGMTGTRV